MRFIVALLAASVVVIGCAQQPVTDAMPKVVSEKPPPAAPFGDVKKKSAATQCAQWLSEASCKEAKRCRWINDYKRADGTWATAYCSAS